MIDDAKTTIEHDSKSPPPRVRVTIHDTRNAWPLVLYFEHLGDSPPFVGFKVLSLEGRGLDAGSFARLARNLPHYIEYARALIEWEGGKAGTALEALREAGRSRGLPDRFYRQIAEEYADLVAAGDPHPIKSIADRRPVHKSRASRWVKEARHRGYLPTEEASRG